jgi:hypothetical protein
MATSGHIAPYIRYFSDAEANFFDVARRRTLIRGVTRPCCVKQVKSEFTRMVEVKKYEMEGSSGTEERKERRGEEKRGEERCK